MMSTIFCIFAIIASLCSGTVAQSQSRRFDFDNKHFGHWLQPLVFSNESITILNNTNILVEFKCTRNNTPVEWIFNDDKDRFGVVGRNRTGWTERKHLQDLGNEHTYEYSAHIQYQETKLWRGQGEWFLCSSILNKSDAELTLVNQNPDTSQVEITRRPLTVAEVEAAAFLDVSIPCPVKFLYSAMGDRYYWACKLQDGSFGNITLYDCSTSAAECANTFRDIKTQARCTPEWDNWPNTSWTPMAINTSVPGVTVCAGPLLHNERGTVAAVEYFFSPIMLGSMLAHHIRFSWNEIRPENMIWVSGISRTNYFINETIHVTCNILKYGFSYDPLITVTLNGSEIDIDDSQLFVEDRLTASWSKSVSIEFGRHGGGAYSVQCLAPVWNTTEWANKSMSLFVGFTRTTSRLPPKARTLPCFSQCNATDERGIAWAGCANNTILQPCPQSSSPGNASWFCTNSGIFEGEGPDYKECNTGWLSSVDNQLEQVQSMTVGALDTVRQVMRNISSHLKVGDYSGNEIPEIARVVEKAAGFARNESVSSQKQFVGDAVSMFSGVFSNYGNWTKTTEEKSRPGTTLLMGTERMLFQLGHGMKNELDTSSSNSSLIQLNSHGTLEAQVGVQTVDNSSMKLWFNKTLEHAAVHANVNVTNSVLLPSGWKTLIAEEDEVVQFVGTSLDSEVSKEVFAPDKESGFVLNTDVVSVSIGGQGGVAHTKVQFEGKGVEIELFNAKLAASAVRNYCGIVHKKLGHRTQGLDSSTAKCVFRDETTRNWSEEGCVVKSADSKSTICECNHLTSFAVLMKPFANEFETNSTLDLLTMILCPISILSLVLSVWILSIVKASSHSLQRLTNYTKHLCISLAIGNTMVFLLMDQQIIHLGQVMCSISAAFTHYVFLVAFIWMGLEGVLLYKLTVQVFESGGIRTAYVMGGVYGVPALIVALTGIIGLATGDVAYGGDTLCWLNGYYLIGSFVLPISIICIVNLVLLSVSLSKAYKRQFKSSRRQAKKSPTAYLFWTKSCFALTLLLGITWIFGLFLLFCDEVVSTISEYLFTLLNASQGLFILLFHCLGNSTIRNELKRELRNSALFKRLTTTFTPLTTSSTNTTQDNQLSSFN